MASVPVPGPAAAANGSMVGPCLSESMAMAEAGRVVIASHFSRMIETECGTADGRDPDALHDMRVATRRMRAALRVFRRAYDAEAVATLDAEVRWLAGLLGRVRDLDVLAEAVAAFDRERRRGRQMPLAWVIAEVSVVRANERLVLLEALSSPRYQGLKEAMARFVDGSSGGATAAGDDTSLREQAAAAIRRQLRAVRQAGKVARSGRTDDLHALRIAAKRLRYTMEFFRALFPPELARTIEATTAVQDHLGAMRDAHVQGARLQQLALVAERDAGELRALRGLLRYLRERETREFEAFQAAYPALVSKEARERTRALLRAPAEGK